jgi:putative hydrolase of the HAD superfamily
MTQPHIKGIIWDFGNILARFDHLKACKKLAEYCATAPEDIIKELFSGENAPAKLHESGELSSLEFFRSAQKLLSFSENLSFQIFSDIWKDIFQENNEVSAVIDRIQPDLKQCILSNTDPIHWSAIEQLPVMKKYFSNPAVLVRSYTSGTRKPDPKMYQDALQCLELAEEEIQHILYIDDIAEYRDAFERMGGNALSYDCSKDPLARLEAGLRKFGVLQA